MQTLNEEGHYAFAQADAIIVTQMHVRGQKKIVLPMPIAAGRTITVAPGVCVTFIFQCGTARAESW
jgi:hypothetical protein